MVERQQVLQLWLRAAALDTAVVAWSFYDGTGGAHPLPDADPPYADGVEALRDGWMVLQTPGPIAVEATNAELPAEFVFERRIDIG